MSLAYATEWPAGHGGKIGLDRPIPPKGDDMQHPIEVWTDPSYAGEGLERMRREYVEYLRGRARPTSEGTVDKYSKSLIAFMRSLEGAGEPLTLSSLTPAAVNRWVREQRERGLSEDGIASRLTALKVFTNRYLFKHLEATTVDLLRKVPRVVPPEHSFEALSGEEMRAILSAFDRGTFEDTRNRALLAVFLSTGLRFSEVLSIGLDGFDRLSGEVVVTGKGARERIVRLSPAALRDVRAYLRMRPAGSSGRLFVTEGGTAITFWGGQSIFRRIKARTGMPRLHAHLLRHNFAKVALAKGAERGVVQDMLGHASPAMTNRYLGDARRAQAARLMPQYSPI